MVRDSVEALREALGDARSLPEQTRAVLAFLREEPGAAAILFSHGLLGPEEWTLVGRELLDDLPCPRARGDDPPLARELRERAIAAALWQIFSTALERSLPPEQDELVVDATVSLLLALGADAAPGHRDRREERGDAVSGPPF